MNKITYKIAIFKNGKFIKGLHKGKKLNYTYGKFYNYIKESEQVIFPKEYSIYKGISKDYYNICILKTYEETDSKFYMKDGFGRNIPVGKIQIANKTWSIIDSDIFKIEETFKVYNNENTEIRMNFREIFKLISKGSYSKKAMTQIILVYNKILIYDESKFNLIICKCVEDSRRLHYELYKNTKKININSLIFNGNPNKDIISMSYRIIEKFTGWSNNRIRRQSTYK